MYTREYNRESGGILIPESYGGVTFSDPPRDEERGAEPPRGECRTENDAPPKRGRIDGTLQAFRDLLPKGLGAFFAPREGEGGRFFGTEELLLLGLAAFLFFSGEGDRECALILMILVFIR